MILKTYGQYRRVYCRHCNLMREQDYFRGCEGMINGICEECENAKDAEANEPYAMPGKAPSIAEIATVALVVIGMLIFGIGLTVAEGAMK